ncbi:MAG: hypothetical protein IMZ50_08715 [Candidatus Atribacteria bacterium]|nr:hypothetical protein [Candidatus Atribacteria bacterium]
MKTITKQVFDVDDIVRVLVYAEYGPGTWWWVVPIDHVVKYYTITDCGKGVVYALVPTSDVNNPASYEPFSDADVFASHDEAQRACDERNERERDRVETRAAGGGA